MNTEKIKKYAEEIHELCVKIGINASGIKVLTEDEKDAKIWWLATAINGAANAADDANWVLKTTLHEIEVNKMKGGK